jgi:hypothetical protein
VIEFYLLGRNVVYSIDVSEENKALFATRFTLVSGLAYSSTLRMELACSFETSIDLTFGASYLACMESINCLSLSVDIDGVSADIVQSRFMTAGLESFL